MLRPPLPLRTGLVWLAAAVVAAAQPPAPAVAARGWLDENPAVVGETTRLRLVIRNELTAAVENVAIERVELGGFEAVGDCWREIGAGKVPACTSLHGDDATAESLAGTLHPGDAIIVWAELRPIAPQGWPAWLPRIRDAERYLTVTYRWESRLPAGARAPVRTEQHGQAHVGPFRVVTPAADVVNAFEKLWLPITALMGAGVGYLVTWWQQRRNERVATVNAMLPKSHENAEKHHLPLMSAVAQVEVDFQHFAEQRDGLASREFDRVVFGLLKLVRQMQHLQSRIGGFYFASRTGEEVSSALWGTYGSVLRLRLQDLLYERDLVLSHIRPTDTFVKFNRRRMRWPEGSEIATAYAAVRGRFGTWLEEEPGLPALWALLGAFQTVLRHEVNRVYRVWYGRSLPPPLRELERRRHDLERAAAELPEDYRARYHQALELIRRMRDDWEDENFRRGTPGEAG